MSAPAPGGDGTRAGLATARPYLLGGVASLSVGAAAIHFAVIFEHFAEYTLYGVFFLVVAWAQMIWAAVVLWRPSRLWLSLGIAGNALILTVYVASRAVGLPVGPGAGHPEPFGGLDGVSAFLEFAVIAWCAALWWRPSLADRPVRRRGLAAVASVAAVPALVIVATSAVMVPGWAGPEGPAGMAAAAPGTGSPELPGMPGMGSTSGLPDMKAYGSTAPPTAAQVIAAGRRPGTTGTRRKCCTYGSSRTRAARSPTISAWRRPAPRCGPSSGGSDDGGQP